MNVKVLTVQAKERSYEFPLSAHVMRSKKSLIVLAYDSMYVWPLNAVGLKLGEDSFDIASLPFHDATGLDGYSEGMQWIPERHLRRKPASPDDVCPDCAVFFTKSRPDKPASPLLQVIDVWQEDHSFTPWVDPNIPLQTTNGLNVGNGIHPLDLTVIANVMANSCPSGWSCYSTWYWWTPYFYYYDGTSGGSGGGSVTINVSPGCTNTDHQIAQNQTAGKLYAELNSKYNYLFQENVVGQIPQYPYGEEAYGGIYESNTDPNTFVYQDPPTIVALSVVGHDQNNNPIYGAQPGPPVAISGYTAVGWYHTHNYDPGNPAMTQNGSHFSPDDQTFFPGLTPYVGVMDNDGSLNPTVNWYSFNNTTGKDSAPTQAGQGSC